jgi:hypothetical protein
MPFRHCEFCENRYSGRHTLLTGIDEKFMHSAYLHFSSQLNNTCISPRIPKHNCSSKFEFSKIGIVKGTVYVWP